MAKNDNVTGINAPASLNLADFKLKPCPFCGRMPKVRYRAFGCSGVCVELRCKPLLRKEHLSVWHGAATSEQALAMAADAWKRKSYGW